MRVRSRPGLMAAAIAVAALLVGAPRATAQVVVSMPNTDQSTTFTASVAEQVTITVPTAVSFTVNNIGIDTVATNASVSATNIVMSAAGRALKISLKADAAGFTSPVAGETYDAADVIWNASTWTSGVGASGTLSSAAYPEIATCTADATGCSTADLAFTLKAHAGVAYAGDHTLDATWKIESVVP